MALMFPLFTQQMFAGMTYKWGLTLWALISLVMAPTPWVGKRGYMVMSAHRFFTQVLFFYGSKIRSRSKVSRKILEAEQQDWDSTTPVIASPIEEKCMQV
jgi:hypothetical protein